MVGHGFGCEEVLQQHLFRYAGGGNASRQFGLSPGYGAGFVEKQQLDPGNVLQHRPAFDQDAPHQPDAAADHDRCRCSKPHGTGASDNDYGYGLAERKEEIMVKNEMPGGKGNECQGNDDGDENS